MSDEPEIPLDVDLSGEGLTLDEIIAVEDLCDEWVYERSGRFMRAVAFVTGRRSNPDLTLEELGEIRVRRDGE